MEVRRLQKIKGGSFTLSLPKEWVEKKGLKKGEQIAVSEEEDGALRLHPLAATLEEPLEVTLAFEDFPDLRALEYCVSTYCIQGSNKIHITAEKIIPAEEKKRLKLLRLELPGVEVTEEEANRLSFQVLIDPATFSLEPLIQKTSSFAIRLQEDAIKSLVDLNLPLAKEVVERSREAQRHYRLTIRQVALASLSQTIAEKVGVKNCQECITFALTARDLSRLVYHSSSIARHVLALAGKERIDRELLGLISSMSDISCEMQRKTVQAFLEKDVKLAIRVMGDMEDVRKREEALLKRIMEKVKDMDTAVTMSMIARDLRRIAGYTIAIADDAMNRVLTPKALC